MLYSNYILIGHFNTYMSCCPNDKRENTFYSVTKDSKTREQLNTQDNLAMKIQLSPVTISPSMYFPLPFPHIPIKTRTSVSSGLLEADPQICKRPPILSIPAIPSPF